jgi:hypothetical protein
MVVARMRLRIMIGLVLLFAGSLVPWVSHTVATHVPHEDHEQHCGDLLPGKRINRTELFLGLSRADGSVITDTEFQRFVDAEIAPRFPDGFTVVAANGQFRDGSGAPVRERARVLVVIHPLADSRTSHRLEEVRASYKARHKQESVLRVDGAACASH